ALSLSSLAAQDAGASLSIEAHLDRTEIEPATQEASLTVTVRSTGLKIPEPVLPEIHGLRLTQAATMQNFSMIQGHVERSVTTVYRVSGLTDASYVIPSLRVSLGSESAQ